MKKSFWYIFLVLLLLLPNNSTRAQPSHAFSWYTSKGDPSLKTIHQITQDSDGFIWLATWDGLLRFDGYQFERHLLPPDKLTNRFISLAADRRGDIWAVAYDNILYRLRKNSGSFLQADTQGARIDRLLCSEDRLVYALTIDGDTLLIDPDTGVTGRLETIIPPGAPINGIYTQEDGTKWYLCPSGAFSAPGSAGFEAPANCAAELRDVLYFGSLSGTIYQCSGGNPKLYRLPTSAGITALAPVPDTGSLLVGTSSGEVYVWTPDIGRILHLQSPSFPDGPISIIKAPSGQIWVYSTSGGLDWFDPEACTLVPFYDSKVDRQGWNGENRVTAVFCDRQGILWAGTNWNGLMKAVIHDEHFLLDSAGPSFDTTPENSVRALFEDRWQRIWVATKDGRLHLYDRKTAYLGDLSRDGTIRRQPGTPMGNVYSIVQDRRGTLWLGTRQDGLIELQPAAGRTDHFRIVHHVKDMESPYGLKGGQVFSLYADGRDRLWIASLDDGLSYVDLTGPERRFVSVGDKFNLPAEARNRLGYVTGGPAGSLLACGTLGLFVSQEPDRWPEGLDFRHFVISEDGQSSAVSEMRQLLVARDSQVYVCSYGAGFNRFSSYDKDHPFTAITTRDGLLSDFTLSAIQDSTGHIWIATDEGLNRYDPYTRRIESYPQERLGHDIHFNEGAPLYTSGGEICFPTTRGILHFKPDQIADNRFVPPLLVTAVGSAQKRPSGPSSGTTIRAGETLEVSYQAMDLTQPEHILYSYRLEGRDRDWIPLGNARNLTLNRLRPGSYRLLLRSTNANGIEVDNTAAIPVTVRARPALSPWAIVIYLLALGAAFGLGYYIRRRRRLILEPYYGPLHGSDREFIRNLVTFLTDHLEDTELDVPQMAAKMNVSRSVLFERTRALLDKSPAALLREIRFEKAKALILEGKHTLSQISYMTGFNDPHYFSSSFKRQFGMTPSEFKKSKQS